MYTRNRDNPLWWGILKMFSIRNMHTDDLSPNNSVVVFRLPLVATLTACLKARENTDRQRALNYSS